MFRIIGKVNYLDILEDKKGKKSTGKFSFRDILGKVESTKDCSQYVVDPGHFDEGDKWWQD